MAHKYLAQPYLMWYPNPSLSALSSDITCVLELCSLLLCPLLPASPPRSDAGLAAAELSLAVEAAVRATNSPDTVGTVGETGRLLRRFKCAVGLWIRLQKWPR